ncbi:hypothetical protein H5410_002437 [Solanum commersonii]|uniref:Uncharacterized protein n=1 Tax=Solanum commersonii TaxID=4109 RepID=A0A9J6B228_SOLCO|nr:hypothetical protein H5410_002437 [Solanum commersonii]
MVKKVISWNNCEEIISMNLQKSKRGRHSATEDHDDNTKCSKIDYSLAMTPKEVVLLERRLNDRQATTTRLLSNTNRTDCSGTMPQIQNNLSIPMSSSTSASGVVKTKKPTNNIKRLRSDYVELKKIPPCKFCNAKRF